MEVLWLIKLVDRVIRLILPQLLDEERKVAHASKSGNGCNIIEKKKILNGVRNLAKLSYGDDTTILSLAYTSLSIC